LELAVATPADRRLRAAVRALLETIERQAGVIVPSERGGEERQ
jgi:hypothetical protein